MKRRLLAALFALCLIAPALAGSAFRLGQHGTTASAGTTHTVFISNTALSSYTIPGDYVSFISVECVGAGGGGQDTTGFNGGRWAAGAGAYSKITSDTLTAGGSVTIQIGTGGVSNTDGTDTWWHGANFAASTCGAKAGVSLQGGGSSSSGIGTTKNSGGTGGGRTGANEGGGGGSGGPLGAGAGGGIGTTGGGGGGGNGGGSNGADANTGFGTGGNNFSGGGGGATAGAAGTSGGGGAGNGSGSGGAGSVGVEWDASHGTGGGGGGGSVSGGNGGACGGGGGGSGGGAGTGGTGGNGCIVFKYSS